MVLAELSVGLAYFNVLVFACLYGVVMFVFNYFGLWLLMMLKVYKVLVFSG